MADDALEIIRLRNNFYRDNYRKVTGALLIAMIIIIVLSVALGYVVTHPPAPQYFATDSQGRIVELTPLDEPNLSQTALLQWANTAAVAAFTYNFVNYRQSLQGASDYFTPDGWQSFIQALNESNNLNAVIAKKLVVTAVATYAPVVLQQGVLDGRYAWRIQIPLLVTYQSASQFTQQNVIVTMLITRISTLDSARGVGIAQFVVTGGGQLQ